MFFTHSDVCICFSKTCL